MPENSLKFDSCHVLTVRHHFSGFFYFAMEWTDKENEIAVIALVSAIQKKCGIWDTLDMPWVCLSCYMTTWGHWWCEWPSKFWEMMYCRDTAGHKSGRRSNLTEAETWMGISKNTMFRIIDEDLGLIGYKREMEHLLIKELIKNRVIKCKMLSQRYAGNNLETIPFFWWKYFDRRRVI